MRWLRCCNHGSASFKISALKLETGVELQLFDWVEIDLFNGLNSRAGVPTSPVLQSAPIRYWHGRPVSPCYRTIVNRSSRLLAARTHSNRNVQERRKSTCLLILSNFTVCCVHLRNA